MFCTSMDSCLRAFDIPRMSGSGLSRNGLGHLHDVVAGHVDRGEAPGAVTVVSRRGEAHTDAIGRTALFWWSGPASIR
jgi:hypothetical protein